MVERLANRLADRIIAENNVSENMREKNVKQPSMNHAGKGEIIR